MNNLSDRGPYLNARNTFQELLAYDTIPIINENDTVAVEEIRFGDNDTLSSQVLIAACMGTIPEHALFAHCILWLLSITTLGKIAWVFCTVPNQQ